MWAYNTASTPVLTSVTLSLDGTKVAFVEQGSSGAILHVLKWKTGEGTASTPTAPATSTSTPSTYHTCITNGTTSCEFLLTYSANANSNSSPFYDYAGANDLLYVGDDGVFSGKSQESSTGHRLWLPGPGRPESRFTRAVP
jgi:hypothetical protein